MTLTQLKYVVEAAAAGTISRAAEKLYISENTVRTHVRHIYAKLAINSREELLAMIDDETPRG